MKKHRQHIPHEVHFFLAIFSLGAMLLVIYNKYFNTDSEMTDSLWNIIDPIVIALLFLVFVFHVFEGIEGRGVPKSTRLIRKKKK